MAGIQSPFHSYKSTNSPVRTHFSDFDIGNSHSTSPSMKSKQLRFTEDEAEFDKQVKFN